MRRHRFWHVLKENRGTEQWRWVCYFDSESDVAEEAPDAVRLAHTPKLICASFLDRERRTREDVDYRGGGLCDLFYKDLSDRVFPRTTMRVIGHNVGYDVMATGAIPALLRLGWRVESLYEKGLTYILRLGGDGGRGLIFLSSTQYWNTKLERVGDLFHLPKFTGIGYREPDFELLRKYCRRDVEIVLVAMEWLQEYVHDNNLGGMAGTLPSLASKAFRHRFMPFQPIIHNYESALVLERASYHGGRTEAWWLGKLPNGKVYKVDVNSMYPAVMASRSHPYKLLRFYPEVTVAKLKELAEKYFVIADVTVVTQQPRVPHKDPSLHKLTFPVGRFKTVLTSHEIEAPLREGEIVECRGVCVYEQARIFTDFVDFFYNERKKAKAAGEDAKAELLKLVMNSLYGKFGQKSTEWVRVGDAPPELVRAEDVILPDGSTIRMRTFGGAVWVNDGAVMESFDSFPAIAASVTSAARALLWNYIEVAGEANVYYMDTDSLFVSEAGYIRLVSAGLIDETVLGKLKMEKIAEDVEIHGAKNYRFGAETRHKGIPADAKRAIDPKDGKEKAVVWTWPKAATWIHEGTLDHFENRAVLKSDDVAYNKGTRTASGRVEPLVLNEA